MIKTEQKTEEELFPASRRGEFAERTESQRDSRDREEENPENRSFCGGIAGGAAEGVLRDETAVSPDAPEREAGGEKGEAGAAEPDKPEKQSKKSLFYEILRFLLVGGTATVFDYAVAYLFYHLILPPDRIGGTLSLVLSTAFGFGVGLAVNWVLSVCFVFRNVKDKKKSRSGKSFLMFTLIGLIGLGLTELGMHFGVSCLPEISLFGSAAFLGISWTWWISKVAMTCIVLVWNYLGRKLFIFR